MSGARKDTTPVTIESPIYVGRMAGLGDNYSVVFETIRESIDTAPVFKGLPEDRCPCPHWGIVLKGRWTARYRDHVEMFEAGDAFYSPPGHLPFAEPGTELITFSPTAELEVVNAVIAKNQAELAASLARTRLDMEGGAMATAQKVRIAYDDIGAGDPAVVLLHGLFGNRTYYAAQAHHLAARHRVLSIDLRGHGQSDVPDVGYSLDVLADDVIRVCEEAGVSRAVFCGHSLAVALKAVVRRPDLAAGLVLLDGVVLLSEAERKRQAAFAQLLETDSWREALLGFFGGIAAGAADRVRSDIAAVPRVFAAPMMRDIAASDSEEELRAARCPLMYVHARMPLELDRLRAVRPDATVVTIPNVGHWPMLTAPDEVNAALDRFLEGIG